MPNTPDPWLADHIRAIGDRIRAERERQNLTQEQLYLAAGVSRWAVQDAEGGRGNPTAKTLLRIARTLGIPLSDLVR